MSAGGTAYRDGVESGGGCWPEGRNTILQKYPANPSGIDYGASAGSDLGFSLV